MNPYKKILPHLIAIAAFLIFVLIYFAPQFKGQELYQGDIVNFKGMAKEVVDYREATGDEALWAGNMFSGMPAYQISVQFSNNLIKWFDNIFRVFIPRPAGYVLMYLIGFYLMGVMLKWDWRISMLGAFGFALSSYFFIILEAGHNSKALAIAYMAPLLGSILMTLKGKWKSGGVLTAFFMALQLGANHFQITYYTFLLVGIIGLVYLYQAIKDKLLAPYLKRIGVISLAVVLGVGCNMGRIWTTYEYTPYTTRGKSELKEDMTAENKTSGLDKDYATAWSYGVAETFTLLIPNFMGGASGGELPEKGAVANAIGASPQARDFLKNAPTYWGQQPFTSGPVYAGAIMCFLFVLGLFILPTAARVWLLVGTLFSLMLAWGKNFMPLTDLFLEYFPMYNKFRAVSMILIVAELCIPLGAVMSLYYIFKRKMGFEDLKKPLMYSFALTGGLALIIALIGPAFFSFEGASDARFSQAGWYAALLEDRASLMRADAFRSFVFIALAGLGLWFYAKQKLTGNVLLYALTALVIIDMTPINKRFLNEENFVPERKVEEPYTPNNADQQILQDDGYYRVYNTTEALDRGARTAYFHKSIGGYHGAKLRRYQELINHHIAISRPNREVLNMLNTKYFIVQGPAARRNPGALGPAWKVKKIRWADDADDVLKEMENFRSFRTAVIETKDAQRIGRYDSSANVSITLSSYTPKHLIYDYSSDKPALVVFSEIYYPEGWNAYIDGEPADYWCANYVLRSMTLPAGKHTVEFKFEPKSYYMGSTISLISSIVLLLLMLILIGKSLFSQRQEE